MNKMVMVMLAAAGWSVFKRDENTLCIGPVPGTVLIVR